MKGKCIKVSDISASREMFRKSRGNIIKSMDKAFDITDNLLLGLLLDNLLASVSRKNQEMLKTQFDWGLHTEYSGETEKGLVRHLSDVHVCSCVPEGEHFSESDLNEINSSWLQFEVRIRQKFLEEKDEYQIDIFMIHV